MIRYISSLKFPYMRLSFWIILVWPHLSPVTAVTAGGLPASGAPTNVGYPLRTTRLSFARPLAMNLSDGVSETRRVKFVTSSTPGNKVNPLLSLIGVAYFTGTQPVGCKTRCHLSHRCTSLSSKTLLKIKAFEDPLTRTSYMSSDFVCLQSTWRQR